MGLREKVALILALISIIQITFVSSSSRDKTSNILQARRAEPEMQSPIMITLRPHKKGVRTHTQVADKNDEAIFKTFNFPDVEYPIASTPRPPFHLQDPKLLERNPVQRAAEYPTSTTVNYQINGNKKYNKKYNNKLTHLKTTKKPGTTINIPEFDTTPKPYCFREEGTFPEVEYPLSAKDTWKPNYWKQIPNSGLQSQAYKNGPENISNTGSNARSNTDTASSKNIINPVSKSDTKKAAPKNTQKGSNSLIDNSQSKVNTNQYATEKSERKSLVMIDVNVPTYNLNKAKDQPTTPPPNLSVCTKSTTPFVLTPYTTIYFDTTSSPDAKTTTSKDNTKSTGQSQKKRKKKINVTKKEDSSTRSKKTTIEDTEIQMTPSTPTINDKNVTPSESIYNANGSKLDTCTHTPNDILSSTYLVTTPSYFNNTNVTTVSPLTIQNDIMPKTSSDNKVASITNAVNTTTPNNRDKGSSCNEDTVRNSNKSSTCEDRSNESPLYSRESDEEFTTDVFLDSDEDISPIFTISTSTLPPLSSVEEAWSKSEVIDPYKSLSYPDELEEMYILVP